MLLEMTRAAHVPVLLDEVVDVLDPQPGETAVDCTFGAGGHARAVANRLGPTGTLIAIDRDLAGLRRDDADQLVEQDGDMGGAGHLQEHGVRREAGP